MNAEKPNALLNLIWFFYKHGLWLSWPFFIFGVGLLCFYIVSAVRLGARYRLHTLPLAAEQTVEFDQPGNVVLWVESPLLTSRAAGLSYTLTAGDGSAVEGHRVVARQRSSSFTRVRFADHVFTIPRPGRYLLRTQGLGAPQPADEDHKLVFMRPHFPQVIGCVLGIILGSFLLIGSLVNFFLRLSQGV